MSSAPTVITIKFCEDILKRHNFDVTEVKLLAQAWIELQSQNHKTHERTINALRKRNVELEADCDIKAHHYKMQALLAEELQKQLDRALERIAKLEAQDRESERTARHSMPDSHERIDWEHEH